MKSIIDKRDSKSNSIDGIDEYNNPMSPFMQLISIDDNRISELRLKKRTVFDNIRARFSKQEEFDEIDIYGSKSQKIVQCYYVIPDEINKKKEDYLT